MKRQSSVLCALFGRIGRLIRRADPPFFTKELVFGESFQIGDYTYGKPTVLTFGGTNRLRIGKYCSIADGVVIFLSGNHRPDWVSTYPFTALSDLFPQAAHVQGHPSSKGDVVIGNDVWIGHEAIIMSGVTVGDGAVIGARSVVTRDVAAYSIVAGNPASVVRKRFDDATIQRLLELQWWNWPIERIKDNVLWLVMPPDDPANGLMTRVQNSETNRG